MLSSEVAIRVNNLSKHYQVYNNPKDRLLQIFDKKVRYQEFKALENISFEVLKGSTVGIVGKNGSGKSTLLQIIAGTVAPSSGSVETNGKVVALLELGSGFNPEFTGRENVYLNGAMFGLSKKDVERKYQEIANFADIGEYIDQPVKTYSSGMFARLAFAVAINMEPDILIVDEILAVGDISFQAKCVSKLRKMKDEGLTLLFVSHSVDALKSLCNSAILLENGHMVAQGTSEYITNIYLASVRNEMNLNTKEQKDNKPQENKEIELHKEIVEKEENKGLNGFRYGKGEVYFQEVEMVDEQGNVTKAFEYGQDAYLRCVIKASQNVENVNISFLVRDITGIDLFGTTIFDEKLSLIRLKRDERAIAEFIFPVALRAGSYSVSVAVNSVTSIDYSDVYLYEQIDGATAFEVIRNPLRPVHYKVFLPVTIGIRGAK